MTNSTLTYSMTRPRTPSLLNRLLDAGGHDRLSKDRKLAAAPPLRSSVRRPRRSSVFARRPTPMAETPELLFANPRGKAFTLRHLRRIVSDACTVAGFSNADRSTLSSAFAAHLREVGLTDHEIAITLGVGDLRTVDRLLKPHRALRSQRQVSPALVSAPTPSPPLSLLSAVRR